MQYHGKFSNLNGKVFDVKILTGTSTAEVPITFSGSPCIIQSSSSGLFSPIKSRSCTLSIVSDSYYMDLYQSSSRGARVIIKDDSDGHIIFRGYLTPNSYDQSYTYIDRIELEAVDAVSTLRDFRLTNIGEGYQYRSFIAYILEFLKECGYEGSLFIPETYNYLNGSSVTDVLGSLFASEANFYDDDEEHQAWTKYEVLEEIMKFMNWSLCPFGDDVYIVDYRHLNSSNIIDYIEYDIQDGTDTAPTDVKTPINISVDDETAAPGSPSLSMEDTFNKVEISDNLYEIEEISPDVFEQENLEDVTIPGGQTITLGQSQWVKTTITKHWLRSDEVDTDVTGYDYQTVSLLKSKSGWTHHFYNKYSLQEIDNLGEYSNCYNTLSNTQYKVGTINKYCNTLGCVIQRYAYRANNGSNNLPTSLDWSDYITFFITDDTTAPFTLTTVNKFELPVLEYEIGEQIMWKPATGTSWITIKGDLWYQYNNAKYGEKNKSTLNTINQTKKFYATAPVEKTSDIDSQKYLSCFRDYARYKDTVYGRGFSTWKMSLEIGGKYWNGTSWVSSPATFYLPYNNNPDNREDEFFTAFGWVSVVSNTDYTDKVGENCYAIPIRANNPNDPSYGRMHLTIYPPLLIPVEMQSLFSQLFHTDVELNWINLPNVIYCKDFEVGYVYTDSSAWYSAQKDSNDSDVVYTNLIDTTYTNEFDSLEFKLNTQLPERPISRSYVCTANGYLKTLKHVEGDEGKAQEKNVIDSYYYHHVQPKKKYTCNMHGLAKPDDIFTSSAIDGRFVLDSYLYDVRNDNNEITLIQY